MSCSTCPFLNHLWLELEYFKCLSCGNVWLDHPSEPEAWKCPSCGAGKGSVKLLKELEGSTRLEQGV